MSIVPIYTLILDLSLVLFLQGFRHRGSRRKTFFILKAAGNFGIADKRWIQSEEARPYGSGTFFHRGSHMIATPDFTFFYDKVVNLIVPSSMPNGARARIGSVRRPLVWDTQYVVSEAMGSRVQQRYS